MPLSISRLDVKRGGLDVIAQHTVTVTASRLGEPGSSDVPRTVGHTAMRYRLRFLCVVRSDVSSKTKANDLCCAWRH